MAKIIPRDNVHEHIKILNIGSPDDVSPIVKNERVLISTRVLKILSVNLTAR